MTKLLIVAPSWIGDLVMTQSLLKLLKHNDPNIIIHVLAPASCAAILPYMPEVSKSIISPFGHGQFLLKQRYQLGKSLRAEKYDWSIVLPNSWKSALVPYFARITRRTGWVGEQRYHLLNDIRKLDKKKYSLMIERFMALGLDNKASLQKPYFKPEFVVTSALLQAAVCDLQINYSSEDKILALCPGAEYGPAKRWPVEYYASLAAKAVAAGWRVWLFGAPAEVQLGEQIMQQADCVNLIGRTSLTQAVSLMSAANAVVCNDSGLMHIASALGRPLVVVYGSSSPFAPPLNDRYKMLQLHLECQPCMKRVCPLGHHDCMRKISADYVWSQLGELLS
jgi:heptosyltransferase II